jgi:hypothetical protein
MGEPIKGWRQVKAIWYFFECLFRGNIPCAKREIEIMSGRAKTYRVFFHPDFWESCRNVGMSEDDINELKEKHETIDKSEFTTNSEEKK